jgi:hypothetical protein
MEKESQVAELVGAPARKAKFSWQCRPFDMLRDLFLSIISRRAAEPQFV